MTTIQQMIDDVDWESTNPSQWAQEVPKSLKLLINEGETENGIAAREKLRNHIAHQSGIYEITLVTIPLLIHLLRSNEISDKSWTLNLIGSIQTQQVIYYQHEEGLKLAHQVYDEMFKGIDLFEAYLNDNKEQYRKFTILILSRFVLHPQRIARALLSHESLEESNEVKIVLVERLGFLLEDSSTHDNQLIEIVITQLRGILLSQNPYLKCSTAITIIQVRPNQVDDDIQIAIIDSLNLIATNASKDTALKDRLVAARTSRILRKANQTVALEILTKAIDVSASTPMQSIFIRELKKQTKNQ